MESERGKALPFLKLKSYTDFSRLPEEYVLPVLHHYIGTFYVKISTVWDLAKVTKLTLFDERKI